MKTINDIGRVIAEQAVRAIDGGSPQSVTTVITRPMWRLWCRFAGMPEDCEPTEWIGIHETRRVWGTRTIVVESEHLACVSFKTP